MQDPGFKEELAKIFEFSKGLDTKI